jgi:ABC-type transport system substrate-binding protein
MWTQRIKTGLVTTTAAASLLLLAACGPSPSPAGSSSAPPTSSSASPTSASPSASNSPSPSGTVSSAAPAAEGQCKAGSLTAATDSTGGGAAGSIYEKLILTNSGTTPCTLEGFAGVSLTADANGAPIGEPATRETTTPVTKVELAPGKSAWAELRYTQAGNYGDCTKVPAAGYRIYPPNDTASLFVAEQHDACSNTGIKLLTITAFQAV